MISSILNPSIAQIILKPCIHDRMYDPDPSFSSSKQNDSISHRPQNTLALQSALRTTRSRTWLNWSFRWLACFSITGHNFRSYCSSESVAINPKLHRLHQNRVHIAPRLSPNCRAIDQTPMLTTSVSLQLIYNWCCTRRIPLLYETNLHSAFALLLHLCQYSHFVFFILSLFQFLIIFFT